LAETPTPIDHESESTEENEINLLDLFLVPLKHKKIIFLITIAAGIVSIIYSLLVTPVYRATTSILPPVSGGAIPPSLINNISSGPFTSLANTLIDADPPSKLYIGILESRTVADGLIEKFDLKERYKTKTMAATYSGLKSVSQFNHDRKNQIVSISVEDKDPKLAAQMANYYVEMLDTVNRNVNVTEGQRKRIFIEERLIKVENDLKAAEDALMEFQEKYKLVSIDQQAKIAIEGAARLKSEIILAETELEVLKKFGTERQNEAIILMAKIEELEKQLSRIEKGGRLTLPVGKNGESADDEGSNFYIPFDEIPTLGLQLARLMREAKIQEKVFELMITHFEMAKLEEAKNVNTIQILDEAVPPDQRSEPKRGRIVLLSLIAAFFLSVLFAFFLELVNRIKTQDPERYEQIKHYLTLWKNQQ